MQKKSEPVLPAVRTALGLILSAAALLCSLGGWLRHIVPADPSWIAIILCGIPILAEAFTALVRRHDIKADLLVSMALIASVCTGEYFAAGEVALIMQLGSLLENYTSRRARLGIEKLARLSPENARIRRDGAEVLIPASEVRAGDILIVFAGETIPADGILLHGSSTVDQSVMTGESIPVEKTAGDPLISGTINQFGTFDMKVSCDYQEGALPRMIRLTQEAEKDRAPIVRLADKWASWMVIIAFSTAVFTWLLTGETLRAVTVLVVFCPCAFILATPTAIAAGIASASKYGILIRSGDALERFSKINMIAFDKTGTLTEGRPQVIDSVSFSEAFQDSEILLLAAHAERYSEHPLGRAIVRQFLSSGRPLTDVTDFQRKNGLGVQAVRNSQIILVGNEELFLSEKILLPENVHSLIQSYQKKGATVLFLAVNGISAGFLALSDVLRSDAAESIRCLKQLGMLALLLTGDHSASAAFISSQAGITDMQCSLMPEQKAAVIRDYERKGKHICMIGDGVNDSPALACASAGIAMGGIGSSIAAEASDAVLVRDDLSSLPVLFLITRNVMKKIRQNILFSLMINLTAVLLSVSGILNPVSGALLHNFGSVFVVVNAALLLRTAPASAAFSELTF